MGVDAGASSGQAYGYNPQADGGSSYSQAPRGTRAAPVDLTADSPPKKAGAKRKSTDDADGDGSAKKKKMKDEEKRLKRFRAKAPVAYTDIRLRALTQRMFVIDRQRTPPADHSPTSHPTETISLAGSTGNIYTITIDKVPSCDCPYARKGNQCKHVAYVLARVLRVRQDLEYQLAFLSSELREIFEKAPPLPSATGDDAKKDGNRKLLEGECPICSEDFEPENKSEKVIYCRAACGNNIHAACFDQWAATKRGGAVPCPFCRTPWATGDGDDVKKVAETGQVNADGYVNVASQLGISGQRDYSTYNQYWLQGRGYHDRH